MYELPYIKINNNIINQRISQPKKEIIIFKGIRIIKK